MTRTLVRGARIVTPEGVVDDGWLLADERIEGIGTGPAPDADARPIDLDGEWLVPGFVDPHCHGGGGSSFYAGSVDDVRVAARTHRAAGTTALLASVASMETARMLAAIRAIVAAIDDGSAPNVVGIHLEGPFLSPRRRGAQTASALREPEGALLESLLEAAAGHARLVTIAPELPGAIALIAGRDDVLFALGHTDADATTFTAAVDAGARHVTHLFNAMPPIAQRDPGPVVRALLDDRLTVELVADGHHLASDTERLALRTAGPGRVVLVTDAMPAAGLGDGHYAFADREVDVVEGTARLAGTTTLAGSTLTMARAVERAVSELRVAVPDVVRMASTNAADRLGWTDRGRIAVGARAPVLVLNEAGRLRRVIAG